MTDHTTIVAIRNKLRSTQLLRMGPKYIVCHHYGAFGHLKPHCSKFHTLKKIKRKEKLEFLGSYAMKANPDLEENGKLLNFFFNVLAFLSMCISGSHSSNPRLTFHEILIQIIIVFG